MREPVPTDASTSSAKKFSVTRGHLDLEMMASLSENSNPVPQSPPSPHCYPIKYYLHFTILNI